MTTEHFPALAAWRTDLAAGERTATTFDPLWRAACLEREAEETLEYGLAARAERLKAEAHALYPGIPPASSAEARRVIRMASGPVKPWKSSTVHE
jgi:hypothetical protein